MSENFEGRKVLVKRCLAAKPQHSGTRFGWILETAKRDASQREACNAAGLACGALSDGIIPVAFISPSPPSAWSENNKQTTVFAHPDDLEITDAPYSFPANEGLTILEPENA